MSGWYKFEILTRLEKCGLVPTLNAGSVGECLEITRALYEGGISTVEILQRSAPGEIPRVKIDAIYELRKCFGKEMLVGAGTVQTPERAQAVIDAGAEFVVSNLTDEKVIETANINGIPMIPGVRDENSVLAAARLGCSLVKIFLPHPALGEEPNLEHLAQFKKAFPRMRFMITAGVTFDLLGRFLREGYLIVPSGLISRDVVESKNWGGITERALKFSEAARTARS